MPILVSDKSNSPSLYRRSSQRQGSAGAGFIGALMEPFVMCLPTFNEPFWLQLKLSRVALRLRLSWALGCIRRP
jgi:hypothetical protein